VTLPPAALDAARCSAEQVASLTDRQRAQLAALLAPVLETLRRRQGAA
jgi:hypothetical protein